MSFCITVWYKERNHPTQAYLHILGSAALFSEVLICYSNICFNEDYRTMIYEYRNWSGFEKSNTGVLMTNQEDVNSPRDMPKTLKIISNEKIKIMKL